MPVVRGAAVTVLICGAMAFADQGPYFGSPLAIPGTVQAQWYDNGGEGVAYHDCDAANNGGAFRPGQGVDVADSNEGNFCVGWMCAGEWIEYSIASANAAPYLVEARVASLATGGSFRLDFFNAAGNLVTSSNVVAVPVTGDWQCWQTVTTSVELPAGALQMRLVNTATSAAYNITCFRLRQYDPIDLNRNGQVDVLDWAMFTQCIAGPSILITPVGCPWDNLAKLDLNNDGRGDLRDFWIWQRIVSGAALVDPAPWELVWSDEFNVTGAPDPAKWRYEVGYRIRNNEEQYYTPGNNAVVENGNLVIEARREPYPLPGGGNAEYTAASMSPRTSWLYGRVEVRAKLPTGRGMWPAIWMLGDAIGQVGWPACGEIDIMENVGYDPRIVHGSVHTTTYNHKIGTQQTSTLQLAAPFDAFHVYAIEWYPDRIDFFVDRMKYLTFMNQRTGQGAWPFDGPHDLKLNIAVGGAWGGVEGIDNSIFPQRFYIDYVRAYRQRAD